eukprot:288221_1
MAVTNFGRAINEMIQMNMHSVRFDKPDNLISIRRTSNRRCSLYTNIDHGQCIAKSMIQLSYSFFIVLASQVFKFVPCISSGYNINLFTILLSIIIGSTHAQKYDNWQESSDTLSYSSTAGAIGYSSTTGTIWLFGGSSTTKIRQIDAVAETATLYSAYFPSPPYVDYLYGWAQFWTSVDNYVYMIDPNEARTFLRFDVDTGTAETNYNSIKIPKYAPECYNGPYGYLPDFDYPFHSCLTSINVDAVDYLVVIGGAFNDGCGGGFGYRDNTQILSLVDFEWKTSARPKLSSGRRSSACVTHQSSNTIYVIGGISSNGCCEMLFLDTVQTLTINDMSTITSHSWGTLGDKLSSGMPLNSVYPTDGPRALVYETDILVFWERDINVIDTSTGSISIQGTLPVDGYNSAVVIAEGKIWMVRGNKWWTLPIGPTRQPTPAPTRAPTTQTSEPTRVPTRPPTTAAPTQTPTTGTPTQTPSKTPTNVPTTVSPSKAPTTETPTHTPSDVPSKTPSQSPTDVPTTVSPSKTPSVTPSKTPSQSPTDVPTTVSPSKTPSVTPSKTPSQSPTDVPTETPTKTPSVTPSKTPSQSPNTASPSASPTTPTPSVSPVTEAPSASPVTGAPSKNPTSATVGPSESPITYIPTRFPSDTPSVAPIDTFTSTVFTSTNGDSDRSVIELDDNEQLAYGIGLTSAVIVVAVCALCGQRVYKQRHEIDDEEGTLAAHVADIETNEHADTDEKHDIYTKQVEEWNVDDVYTWLSTVSDGDLTDLAGKFKAARIRGIILDTLRDEHLDEFDVKFGEKMEFNLVREDLFARYRKQNEDTEEPGHGSETMHVTQESHASMYDNDEEEGRRATTGTTKGATTEGLNIKEIKAEFENISLEEFGERSGILPSKFSSGGFVDVIQIIRLVQQENNDVLLDNNGAGLTIGELDCLLEFVERNCFKTKSNDVESAR